MIKGKAIAALSVLAAVAGCSATLPYVAHLQAPEAIATHTDGPPNRRPDTCWGLEVTPAIIETVTHQIMLQPAEVLSDGTVLSPAIYKTETQQAIVRERRELWFETPCQTDLTPDFVASLQRALQARGYLRGGDDGVLDARTKRAVGRYQREQGLNSDVLSLAAARRLGLVAYGRETLSDAQ